MARNSPARLAGASVGLVMRAALLVLTAAGACAPEAPRVLSVTALEDTRDTTGPYVVQGVVRGLVDGDTVEVHYAATDPPRFAALPVRRLGGGIVQGDIPGQPRGTTVRYYLAVNP